jgi:hypothetical protein
LVIKFVKFTLFLLGICVLSTAPVCADTHTFTFTSTLGDLGHTRNFTSGPLTLTATGWLTPGAPPIFTVPGDLFAKSGSNESGLGLALGPDHEIFGTGFIQLNLAALLASVPAPGEVKGVSISMDSITLLDSYAIHGSNGLAGGPLGTTITNFHTAPTFAIPTSDLGFHWLNVSASSGTVLLEDVEVTTPEPSSAGLLLIGLGALVAAGTLGKKLIA